MNFTEVSNSGYIEHVSGPYRVTDEVAGFGMNVSRAYYRGGLIAEKAGHNALQAAMEACRDHQVRVPELHLAEGGMGEEGR